jgi:hypothetical protein
MMESINSSLQNSHHFIECLPQPEMTTADEALQWGKKCNKRHVSYMGDWTGLALSHLAYKFYVAASFSKNPEISGEAYFRIWQIESEGRAPHSTHDSNENRGKGLKYLKLSALQGYSEAKKLLSKLIV